MPPDGVDEVVVPAAVLDHDLGARDRELGAGVGLILVGILRRVVDDRGHGRLRAADGLRQRTVDVGGRDHLDAGRRIADAAGASRERDPQHERADEGGGDTGEAGRQFGHDPDPSPYRE